MQIAQTILAKLNEVFSPMDAEVLAASQVWAKGRKQALREFKDSDEAKEMRRDQGRYYRRLYAIAGGKTWYDVFDGRNDAMIEAIVEKNCAATVRQRNAKIAAKLEKAGVTEVLSEEFTHTRDGFDGVFAVKTDAGIKRVIIRTIRAGGHNIQCLHLRVLVNVR
jgi:hypothetical protein